MTTERAMTPDERRQLNILHAVYENPTITGTWNKSACDGLVELGYAENHEYHGGIKVAHITEAGIAAVTLMRSTTVSYASTIVLAEDIEDA